MVTVIKFQTHHTIIYHFYRTIKVKFCEFFVQLKSLKIKYY